MEESRDEILKKFLEDEDIEVEEDENTFTSSVSTGSVFACIHSGYTMRRLIEIISENIPEGNICFYPKRMKISHWDTSGRFYINAKIYTYKLIEYTFDSPTGELDVGFNFKELKKCLNPAGKTQSISISVAEGKAKISIIGKDESYHYHPTILPIEKHQLDFSSLYVRGKDSPNVTCLGSQISQALIQMHKVKGDVYIYCYEDGIEICPAENKENQPSSPIGKCKIPIKVTEGVMPALTGNPQLDRVKLRSVTRKLRVPKLLAKNLSKVKFLCEKGTVRLYISGKGPLIIATELSNFGTFEVIVRDEDSDFTVTAK